MPKKNPGLIGDKQPDKIHVLVEMDEKWQLLIFFPSQIGKGKKHHAATSSPRGSGGGNDKKHDTRQSSSNLPPALASRLHQLFNSVEREFEALYLENNQLRQRVSLLEKGDTPHS